MWNDSNNPSTTHLGVADTPLPSHLYDQPEEAKLQVLPSTAPLAQAQRSNRPTVLLSLALVISLLLAVGGSYLGYNLGLERGRIEGSSPLPLVSNLTGDGPFRPQSYTNIGAGSLARVSYSDGMLPLVDAQVDGQHPQTQHIRSYEDASGCAVARYTGEKLWLIASAPAHITLNGQEIAHLTNSTTSHGYLLDQKITAGDQLCVSNGQQLGISPIYYLFWGPSLYYHYDSYCYRSGCNIDSEIMQAERKAKAEGLR